MTRFVTCLGFVVGGLIMATNAPATADTVYRPGADKYNGHVIYLSRACHDGNDGVPGGPCIPNYGCYGSGNNRLNENTISRKIARAATYAGTSGLLLLDRGYRVVIGDGTVGENIANSNSRPHVTLHIPIHSNASGNGPCYPRPKSDHGTETLYRYADQRNCGDSIRSIVGGGSLGSPGTRDVRVPRTDLGELNRVNATSCYLEAEYHDTNRGVNWLRDRKNWAWMIGSGVDGYLGYPRA